MNKYYFVTVMTKELGRECQVNMTIDMHPMELIKKLTKENIEHVITFYHELSKEEYLKFKEMSNE